MKHFRALTDFSIVFLSFSTIRPLGVMALLLIIAACAPSITPMTPRAVPGYPANIEGRAANPVPASHARDGRILPSADADFFSLFTLMVPVEGIEPAQITDTYNQNRSGGRTHRATDILAPKGTRIVAAVPGVIVRISDNPLGGKTIYQLDQVSRYLYYYAHLDEYAPNLKIGQVVNQGQLLGFVGSTGNATTPHLHFQAMRYDPKKRDYWNGDPVDVRPFFSLKGEEYR